jgi:hypothetical protein
MQRRQREFATFFGRSLARRNSVHPNDSRTGWQCGNLSFMLIYSRDAKFLVENGFCASDFGAELASA